MSSVLATLVVSAVIFCPAQLIHSGFEDMSNGKWDGPGGGGVGGGGGTGQVVGIGKDSFVRSGARAVCLEIWDDGSPDSVAWAAIMQTIPCDTQRKIRVGAWLYFSSSVLPLGSESTAHLRIEYFEDKEGLQLIPTHIYLSPPFDPASYEPDSWHLIEACDRIPRNARSLRVSVVVTGQGMNGRKQAVWLDDLYVDLSPAPFPRGMRRPGKSESTG